MQEEITIRKSTPEDEQKVRRLWDYARASSLGLDINTHFSNVSSNLYDLGVDLIVAQKGKKIVGSAKSSPAVNEESRIPIPCVLHISLVAVDPTVWGLGLGKKLMIELLKRLDNKAYHSARLWTPTNNERARRLYASLGFKETAIKKNFEDGDLGLNQEISLWILDKN